MNISTFFSMFLLLAMEITAASAPGIMSPSRVISLDYCADQYVLKLLPKANILALSQDATSEFSFMKSQAEGIQKIRSTAEEIIAARPDLVVRSYGGGPQITKILDKANIPLLQIHSTSSINDVFQTIKSISAKLGVAHEGVAIIANLERRLAKIPTPTDTVLALYLSSSGVTAGPGTLIDEIITTAGFVNTQKRVGWSSIRLENIAHYKTDFIFSSLKTNRTGSQNQWNATKHPMFKEFITARHQASLPVSLTSCGAWYVIDAIEQLVSERLQFQARQ
jgi:iron complex transport system substrate-binding protein